MFNYLITVLVSGSYLAKITSVLGLSDSLPAILNSFVTLDCCTQILSGLIFRGGRIKRRITTIFLINQLLLMLLYLVPIVRLSKGVRTVLFVVLLLYGHLMLNLALAPWTNWFMSFVDNGKRGVFTAKKKVFSLLAGFVFQMTSETVSGDENSYRNHLICFAAEEPCFTDTVVDLDEFSQRI